MSGLRTRWAAIGAAVAVTLGAGGIGITHATTSSGARPVYVPIEPCRLADTRPAPDTVGPRSTPLGPAETYDIDGWGAVGNCNLPTGTAGLNLNVTALGATQQTNLRFFPESAALPTTANLNPTPGAPPTPNAVAVTLNGGNGTFSVYNRFGTVAVVIDVMGYYTDHTHDDQYYTKAESDAALAGKTDEPTLIPGSWFRLQPLDLPSSWTRSISWNHAATPGTSECLFGVVDVPAGRMVTSVSLGYFASTPATIDLDVSAISTGGQPFTSLSDLVDAYVELNDVALPVSGSSEIVSFTPAITPHLVADNEDTLLVLCTEDQLNVWSIDIGLA